MQLPCQYGHLLQGVADRIGSGRFRHEFVFGSQVINIFKTGMGESLALTTAGYDQEQQVASVRRFWETLDALKNWEESK